MPEKLIDVSFKLPESYAKAWRAIADGFAKREGRNLKHPSGAKLLMLVIEEEASDLPSARKHLRGIPKVRERYYKGGK